MDNLILYRITVHYNGYDDDRWLLFEHGNLAHPLLVLTDLEMKRLVEQYQRQVPPASPAQQEDEGV